MWEQADAVPEATRQWLATNGERRQQVQALLGSPVPARPPGMCIGCPERPVFSALKLAQQDVGPVHIAGDIGCHALATFEPFSFGHSILGYGMSLASRAGVRAMRLFGRGGWISRLPLAGGWTAHRDLPRPAGRTFMEQYRAQQAGKGGRP